MESEVVGQGGAIGGREVTDLDDASGSMVDGVGAIVSREAIMALWWIGMAAEGAPGRWRGVGRGFILAGVGARVRWLRWFVFGFGNVGR